MANTNQVANRANKSSTFTAMGGRRAVKAYPVTESELSNMFLLQAGSTVCFSLATFFAGIWLNVAQGLALASGVPAAKIAFWSGLEIAFGAGTILFAVIGFCLVCFGRHKVSQIKGETTHS